MAIEKNGRLTQISKVLRRNMTRFERRLWYDYLKKLSVTVHRQRPIGPYIADFYIPSAALVIELDGKSHRTEKGINEDAVRDMDMTNLGLTVLRFSDERIDNHFSDVCREIASHLPKTEEQ